METDFNLLKLEHQVCFPLYAVSRLITKQYKPFLDALEITYPQYLVLLVLWETDGITVNAISQKLYLETNTITPLLKRMEVNGILDRKRSETDERCVLISLTAKGKELKMKAVKIPAKLLNKLDCFSIDKKELIKLKNTLDQILQTGA